MSDLVGNPKVHLSRVMAHILTPLLFRIMGWHSNKELDDIEETMMNQEQREPHCTRCEHLGRFDGYLHLLYHLEF